jgi:hypothetical protein
MQCSSSQGLQFIRFAVLIRSQQLQKLLVTFYKLFWACRRFAVCTVCSLQPNATSFHIYNNTQQNGQAAIESYGYGCMLFCSLHGLQFILLYGWLLKRVYPLAVTLGNGCEPGEASRFFFKKSCQSWVLGLFILII